MKTIVISCLSILIIFGCSFVPAVIESPIRIGIKKFSGDSG
jgi:hypothetical protein